MPNPSKKTDDADAAQLQPFAEFQALPLEYIISAPLTATIRAQSLAAQSTLDYINTFKDENVEFKLSLNQGEKQVEINAPLLSMVPVPHIRIDSLNVNFRYEIKHTVRSEKTREAKAEVSAKVGGNPWVKASITGSVSSKSGSESEMNRSGLLEISVQASEAPVPEGLAKILTILKDSIEAPESGQ